MAILSQKFPAIGPLDLTLGLADAFPGGTAIEFAGIVGVELTLGGCDLTFPFWAWLLLLKQVSGCRATSDRVPTFRVFGSVGFPSNPG